jgi:Transcriptional regulators
MKCQKRCNQTCYNEEYFRESWKTLIPVLMRTMKKDMDDRCRKEMDEYGISKIHLGYLMVLSQGEATLTSLSDALSVDKSNTTRAITDLRSKGLVVDDREKENSKKYNLSLTEEGAKLTSMIENKLDEAFDEYVEGISQKELRSLVRTLEKIKDNIEKNEISDDV